MFFVCFAYNFPIIANDMAKLVTCPIMFPKSIRKTNCHIVDTLKMNQKRSSNKAPIKLQQGFNRGKISDCWVSSSFVMFFESLWVLNIPKLLIKVPGPIAILVKGFLELRKFSLFWTRVPPKYYQNASTNTRKNCGNIFDFFNSSI